MDDPWAAFPVAASEQTQDRSSDPWAAFPVVNPDSAAQRVGQNVLEVAKGIPSGIVSGTGQAMEGVAALGTAAQQNAYHGTVNQQAIFDKIDAGEPVPESLDPMGYGQMDPQQRAATRAQINQYADTGKPSPLTDNGLYQAGVGVENYGKTILPAAPGYENSIGRGVGEGIGAIAPAIGIGMVPYAGPVVAPAIFGAQTAGQEATRAVKAGATDEQIAHSAEMGALVGAAVGKVNVESVLSPIAQSAPGALDWAVTKLAQAGRSGIVFPAVGEAQEYLATQFRQDYDPKAQYEFDPHRVITGALTGAILGPIHPAGVREQAGAEVPPPTPGDVASPIPTDLIQEGKGILADAQATLQANKHLSDIGLPEVGTPVHVDTGDGVLQPGTIQDAFSTNNELTGTAFPGAHIAMDDGSRLSMTGQQMQSLGVKVMPRDLAAEQRAADLAAPGQLALPAPEQTPVAGYLPAPELSGATDTAGPGFVMREGQDQPQRLLPSPESTLPPGMTLADGFTYGRPTEAAPGTEGQPFRPDQPQTVPRATGTIALPDANQAPPILKNDGTPFATEKSAQMAVNARPDLKGRDFDVVGVDGGFALRERQAAPEAAGAEKPAEVITAPEKTAPAPQPPADGQPGGLETIGDLQRRMGAEGATTQQVVAATRDLIEKQDADHPTVKESLTPAEAPTGKESLQVPAEAPILRKDGTPWQTKASAEMAMKQRADLKGNAYDVVPVDGGFALAQKDKIVTERAKANRTAPLDLNEFLASQGGIRDDEGYDLNSGRNLQRLVPGYGNLIRPNGLGIDNAGERLHEAGYFGAPEATERPSEAQVLDKLEEARTQKVYADKDLGEVQRRADEQATKDQAREDANTRAQIDAHDEAKGLAMTPEEKAAAFEHVQRGEDVHDAVTRAIEDHAIYHAEDNAETAHDAGEVAHEDIPFDLPAKDEAGDALAGEGARSEVVEPGAAEREPAGGGQPDEAPAEAAGAPDHVTAAESAYREASDSYQKVAEAYRDGKASDDAMIAARKARDAAGDAWDTARERPTPDRNDPQFDDEKDISGLKDKIASEVPQSPKTDMRGQDVGEAIGAKPETTQQAKARMQADADRKAMELKAKQTKLGKTDQKGTDTQEGGLFENKTKDMFGAEKVVKAGKDIQATQDQMRAEGKSEEEIGKATWDKLHDDGSDIDHLYGGGPGTDQIIKAVKVAGKAAMDATKAAAAKIDKALEGTAIGPRYTAGKEIVKAGSDTMGAVLSDIEREVHMFAMPMGVHDANTETRAVAKRFANAERKSYYLANQYDTKLRMQFSKDDLKAMWETQDRASVTAQKAQMAGKTRFDAMAEGLKVLDSLPPEQRKAVDQLNQWAESLWQKARDTGMVKGDGLPLWTPRMAVMIGEDGNFAPLRGGKDQGKPSLYNEGRNLTTTTSSLLHREHLEAADTEAGMKKVDDSAKLVRDIRTMPLALGRLERAIAGREMVNAITDLGVRLGQEATSTSPREGFVSIPHPALTSYRPKLEEVKVSPDDLAGKGYDISEGAVWGPSKGGMKPLSSYTVHADGTVTQTRSLLDSNGHPVMEPQQIYVAKSFEGPLRAVLRSKPGELYKAFMALKGETMSLVMLSPAIHNVVEYGRALPKTYNDRLGFGAYWNGAAVLRSPDLMERALDTGTAPIGNRGYKSDITGIAEGPQIKPGNSLLSKGIGGAVGMFDEAKGESTKEAIDTAGNWWHNTLLWDMVGKLQMGIWKTSTDHYQKAGLPQYAADVIASHEANRYAGALPAEAMGQMATKLANLRFFSRTFTFGNYGVIKDAIFGLPADSRALIESQYGAGVAKTASNMARLSAMKAVAIDVGVSMVANAVLQTASNLAMGQSWDDQGTAMTRRIHNLIATAKWGIPGMIGSIIFDNALSPTADNEPGKENRIKFGHDEDGTAIYWRSPLGKVGESFTDTIKSPLLTQEAKEGTLYKGVSQALANDKGFGLGHRQVPIYNPYSDDPAVLKQMKIAGLMARHVVFLQTPKDQVNAAWNAAKDITGGETPQTIDVAKAIGPLFGVTASKGAPGGEPMGEYYDIRGKHDMDVAMQWPDIRDTLREYKKMPDQKSPDAQKLFNSALDSMIGLGMSKAEIKSRIQGVIDPGLTKGKLKAFSRYATPEQMDRMNRAIEDSE